MLISLATWRSLSRWSESNTSVPIDVLETFGIPLNLHVAHDFLRARAIP
jgi:hypothetical protein